MTKYKYEIIDDKDGSNVMGEGQVVYEDNAYIAMYPVPVVGQKPVKDLAVGESTLQTYNRSGTRGVYRVTRVE